MKLAIFSIACIGFLSFAQANTKIRFPASLDCESPTTEKLSGLVYSLNIDNTIKQNRYAAMMNEMTGAETCEDANKVLITTIADCTVKSLKKTKCK